MKHLQTLFPPSASPPSGSRIHFYEGPLLHRDMQRSKAPHTTLLWVRVGLQPLLDEVWLQLKNFTLTLQDWNV